MLSNKEIDYNVKDKHGKLINVNKDKDNKGINNTDRGKDKIGNIYVGKNSNKLSIEGKNSRGQSKD